MLCFALPYRAEPDGDFKGAALLWRKEATIPGRNWFHTHTIMKSKRIAVKGRNAPRSRRSPMHGAGGATVPAPVAPGCAGDADTGRRSRPLSSGQDPGQAQSRRSSPAVAGS